MRTALARDLPRLGLAPIRSMTQDRTPTCRGNGRPSYPDWPGTEPAGRLEGAPEAFPAQLVLQGQMIASRAAAVCSGSTGTSSRPCDAGRDQDQAQGVD